MGGGNKWGKDNPAGGYGTIQFSLKLPATGTTIGQPEPISAEKAASDFYQARATNGALTLAHRKGGAYGYDAHPRREQGRQGASHHRARADRWLQHRSYTFTPDGQTIISGGGNGNLIAYDLKGK